MFSGPGIEILLENNKIDNSFTNLDVIRGKVVITVPRETTFAAIEVKLKGVSKSSIFDFGLMKDTWIDSSEIMTAGQSIPTGLGSNNYFMYNSSFSAHNEKHILLLLSQNLGNNQNGIGSVTLAKGRNEFHFEFIIPAKFICGGKSSDGIFQSIWHKLYRLSYVHVDGELPPSYHFSTSSAEAIVKYFIKVTCRNQFLPNVRGKLAISYFPRNTIEQKSLDDVTTINGTTMYSKFSRSNAEASGNIAPCLVYTVNDSLWVVKLTLEARFQKLDPHLEIESPFTGRFYVSCNVAPELFQGSDAGKLYLQSFETTLVSELKIRGNSRKLRASSWTTSLCQVPLGNIEIDMAHVSRDGNMELPILAEQIWVPNTVSPNFKTCNISLKHRLKMDLSFTSQPMTHPPHLWDKLKGEVKHLVIEENDFHVRSGISQLRNTERLQVVPEK